MPNKAKYLSVKDIQNIIQLRGKEQPKNIAAKYKIGLTRLYKIWTDASSDKKFPGGFAGTVAGQHLTSQMEAVQQEIDKQRDKHKDLQDLLKKYNEENKKLANRIEKQEKHLTVQIAKIIKNKEEEATINEFLATWKQKKDDYIKIKNEVKHNEELIKQQQDKLKKSQIAIAENKKLLEQRMSEDEEIQKTLASDNSELERQLNEVYE
ncbi:hypothetical protein ACJMK2_006627 [Sinanodonta woodiana]|uniref:Uncharacterized protein n=1 Tax=Sinanodonta woodiana TaxID=1069815 RepID=A0ABD3VWV2_SINWO